MLCCLCINQKPSLTLFAELAFTFKLPTHYTHIYIRMYFHSHTLALYNQTGFCKGYVALRFVLLVCTFWQVMLRRYYIRSFCIYSLRKHWRLTNTQNNFRGVKVQKCHNIVFFFVSSIAYAVSCYSVRFKAWHYTAKPFERLG